MSLFTGFVGRAATRSIRIHSWRSASLPTMTTCRGYMSYKDYNGLERMERKDNILPVRICCGWAVSH